MSKHEEKTAALPVGSYVPLVLKLIDLVALGVIMAPEIKAKYQETVTKLKQIASEKRNPNAEEWNEVNTRLDEALSVLEERAKEASE